MKYCYECGRITAGEPLFCNFCGRSYDVKLCSRRHVNPRAAEVCSTCGSRELSTPGPRVSFLWKIIGFLARALVVLLMVYVLLAILYALLVEPGTRGALIALGLLLIALWFIWGMLPNWLRQLVRRSLGKKGRRDDQ